MPAETKTIRFAADAKIEAASADGKGPRKFSMLAYGGGQLRVAGWSLPVVIDLQGMGYAKSIVANKDHESKDRVGHVTEKMNDGKTLVLAGVVSATGPAAQEVVADHDNGFPWQASVEAKPDPDSVEFVPEGKKVSVNQQIFAGPIYVARKSTLYGVAFVPRGADENTSVAIAATSHQGVIGMDVINTETRQQILAADRQRQAAIIAACDDYQGRFVDEVQALKAKAIESDMMPVDVQSKLYDYYRRDSKLNSIEAAASHIGPQVHGSGRDGSPRTIEAALCMTRGLPNIEKQFDERTLEAAHKHFRGLGLQQALIMAAASNGYVCRPGERITNGNLREVLRYAFPPLPIHAASTLSLPGILSNVANKESLAGYMEEDQTWREISTIKPVVDFKQAKSYRMLDNVAYEELGPDGRIKHGTLGEESYTRQAKTYAKLFAFTRTDIINDDLGAFDDMRNRIGRGGALKFNDVFWITVMGAINGGAFFTTARGNYISGSTTNLGTDGVGLGLALKAFRQLKSPSADGAKKLSSSVGGVPAILLVSPDLEAAADKLFMGEKLNVGSSGGGDENIYKGKYRPVVSPWISDSTVSGSTSTGWGLFRNPANMAPVAVSFLNGNQSPTVETAEADFDQLGVQFRGFHDFGVDMAEYLSGVWSKGAA